MGSSLAFRIPGSPVSPPLETGTGSVPYRVPSAQNLGLGIPGLGTVTPVWRAKRLGLKGKGTDKSQPLMPPY